MNPNRRNNNISVYSALSTVVILLFTLSGSLHAQDETIKKYELGMNLGSISFDNRESFFNTESSFYPEIGAWMKLNEEAKIGLVTGLIYIERTDLHKKIFLFPTELEIGLVHTEPEFRGGPEFYAQVCIGLGSNFSTGDIYRNSSIASLKLGVGLISEISYFNFDIRRIYCRAGAKETLSYGTGRIKDEMDLGGYAYTVGMGVRY